MAKVFLWNILKQQTFDGYAVNSTLQNYYTTNTTYTSIKYKFTNAYITNSNSNYNIDNCKFIVKIVDGNNTVPANDNYKILNTPTTFEKEITGTPNFKFYLGSTYDYSKLYGKLKIYTGFENTPSVKWLPRVFKNIGSKATITIFGVHTDGSRITQETE